MAKLAFVGAISLFPFQGRDVGHPHPFYLEATRKKQVLWRERYCFAQDETCFLRDNLYRDYLHRQRRMRLSA